MNIALEQANNENCLVTFGIKPSRPDTGYGYIQFDEQNTGIEETSKLVKTFTEKPDLENAQKFIASGDFYWNSGIFAWNLSTILASFEAHLPDIYNLLKAGTGKYNTDDEAAFISEAYSTCESISIDYGIMENSDRVFVVLSDFGWSDLGTWGSLYTHMDQDTDGNAVKGKMANIYDSKGCIVNVPDNKLVILQGLDECIVVENDDILLVCKKEDEQKIKQYVNDAKAKFGESYG